MGNLSSLRYGEAPSGAGDWRRALAQRVRVRNSLQTTNVHALDGTGTMSSHSRVALVAAVEGVVEDSLDLARDRAGLAEVVIVDLAHRAELGGGAREEELVGERELGAGDVALDDLVAEVAGDLDDRAAVDAVEDARRRRRRDDLTVLDDEDVLPRALADVAVVVEQDRLLVAGVMSRELREDRVEVLAARLRLRDQRVGRDPPPRRDVRRGCRAACPRRRGRRPTPRRRSPSRRGSRAGRAPSGRRRGRRSAGCSSP